MDVQEFYTALIKKLMERRQTLLEATLQIKSETMQGVGERYTQLRSQINGLDIAISDVEDAYADYTQPKSETADNNEQPEGPYR